MVNNRYKWSGKEDELVFFNNFQGFIQESIPIDRETENKFGDVYGKIGLIGKADNYFRIKLARLVRDIEGFRLVKTNKEVLVPDFVVFPTP